VLGGDYQFLCTNYGHKGACSSGFCLFCKAKLHQKRSNPESCHPLWGEEETRKTMADLVQETGHKPIFPIETNHVTTLPLHLMLGLTKDYLDMFRKEVLSSSSASFLCFWLESWREKKVEK